MQTLPEIDITGRPTSFRETRRGKSVHTPYTDAEALEILRAIPGRSNFAEDLAKATKHSTEMMTWVHILACEAMSPKQQPPTEQVGDFSRFKAMLAKAAQHLKKPKIRLRDDEGHSLTVYIAGEESREDLRGQVYVKLGYDWVGREDRTKRWSERKRSGQ